MMVNSTIITFMEMELIHGLMEENIKENGKIIKWTEKENLLGQVKLIIFFL
jgi:hypothetical protein